MVQLVKLKTAINLNVIGKKLAWLRFKEGHLRVRDISCDHIDRASVFRQSVYLREHHVSP